MFKEDLVDVVECERNYWKAREAYRMWKKRDEENRNGLSNQYVPYLGVMGEQVQNENVSQK